MRRSILFLFSICILLSVMAINCGPKNQGMVGGDYPNSEMRIYEVYGMDCPGCHGGLEKLVKRIPGVLRAEGNWEKKQLMVLVQPGTKLSDDDIFDAIKLANFTPGKRLQ